MDFDWDWQEKLIVLDRLCLMDFELKKKRYLACCGSLGFVNKDSLICDA